MKRKTAAEVKAIFNSPTATRAAALMEPRGNRGRPPTGEPPRIRRSAVLPPDLDQAIMDESLALTAKAGKHVSYNEVLCSIVSDWKKRQK
jgi:hypothetical protein